MILAGGGLRAVAPLMLAPELAAVDGADVVELDRRRGPCRRRSRGRSTASAAAWSTRRCPPASRSPCGAARPGLDVALDPGILAGLRRRKAPDELEQLRAAGREADAAADWIATLDLAGWSERRLALALKARFVRHGAEPYDGYVVASGANAALPHHPTGDDPIDAGRAPAVPTSAASIGGYHSDLTRMYLPPDPDPEVAEALALVQAAHDAVLAGLAPGMTCHEADALARDVIAAAGHGDRFLHRTGHGVGLEIHEEPYLRPGNDDVLRGRRRVQRGAWDLRDRPLRGAATRTSCTSARDGPELLNRDPRS